MNIGGIALLILILIAAVFGIVVIASNTGTTPYVDTGGNTTSAQTNATQRTMGNITAPATTVGTGIVILVIILFFAGVIAFLYGATKWGGSSRSRYN